MHLTAGSRLGAYEVVELLGSGGMGHVYRARDTKLRRDVALKVLPDHVSADPERVARFEREAQLLATLNHPHIAAIYGLEEGALVLELVDGPTLEEVIAQAALKVSDAISIARQIVEALEAAHDKGIIHRDLKPVNIKVTADGVVKVLDFGLAKLLVEHAAVANQPGPQSISHSPTVIASMPGTILGTSAYMSPEQATGKEADRTSDVWAFGCVMYEMLTGRRVFEGDSVSEIIANVLRGDPDWTRLPADTPQSVRRVLRRCLNRDRHGRLRDIGDARLDLEEALHETPAATPAVGATSRRTERMAWMTAVALLTIAVVAAITWALRAASSSSELRLEVLTPPTTDPTSLAISPDGTRLVFVANGTSGRQLWLRALDTTSAQPVAGTAGASSPFWSPDGRSIAFTADNTLKRIDIDTGLVRTLASASFRGQRGSWNREGTILQTSPAGGGPILRVSASGGPSAPVTRMDPQHASQLSPFFLPDGRHFLYYVGGPAGINGSYVASLDDQTMTGRRLTEASQGVAYTSGHLLLALQQTLFAQPFDADRLELTGEPVPVALQVLGASVSASPTGRVLFRTAVTGAGQTQLAWFDRSGKKLESIGDPIAGGDSPSLSPDGRRLALSAIVNGNRDIYVVDLEHGVSSRLTFDPALDNAPIWSPDGGRIAYENRRTGRPDLYQKASTGAGAEELLIASSSPTGIKILNDWSPDGHTVLYHGDPDAKQMSGIWALPVGQRQPVQVVQTDFDQGGSQFSSDGMWIAYQSDESGRFEIYVQPFPGPGGKWQVSSGGGLQVRWRHDDKELFYVGLDNRLMAVPIHLDSAKHTVDAGRAIPLFMTPLSNPITARQQYVVSPDGQRFLFNGLVEAAASPITVILNWQPTR